MTYGTGDSDLVMQVGGNLPALGSVQAGNAGFDSYGASFRLGLDGAKGKTWPIRPFISVAYDHLSQDGVTLTGGGVTDLVIDQVNLDRIAFGYGLRFAQEWGYTTLDLGAAGYHYTGDTQTSLNSRFLPTGATGASFTTVGYDIKNQLKIDGGLTQYLGGGWNISADGFAEFGDLEGYGGVFSLSKRF